MAYINNVLCESGKKTHAYNIRADERVDMKI